MTQIEPETRLKRILVISYSQSGQLDEIIDSFLTSFKREGIEIILESIHPVAPFPFPWSIYGFLDVFPESFQGRPIPLHPLKVSPDAEFDLVVIGYQVWYLAPSLPVGSFLQCPDALRLLQCKPVITIVGARNMWYRAHEQVKAHLRMAGARLVGHIALTDRAFNLVSVVTILYWMLGGKKERLLGLFPKPGISLDDIAGCADFGSIVLEGLAAPGLPTLQRRLDEAGACRVVPHLMALERVASQAFRIWSNWILHANERRRSWLVRIFGFYLAAGIALISPLSLLLFNLALPFRGASIKREIEGVRQY
jgi:hypothetical protein